jgi:hypothetical protein
MATQQPFLPRTESYDARFDSLILFNAELELLADGFRWLEGPVWFGDHQCLLFNDIPNNRTMRWSERHGVTVFRESSDYGNGQTRDRQGRLSVLSRFQPAPGPDQDKDGTLLQRPGTLYVMDLDCGQELYRDRAVNGLPRWGASWALANGDPLAQSTLRAACAAAEAPHG